MGETETHDAASSEALPTRRTLFQWLTLLLAVVSAVLVAIPFVGFVAGALGRKRKPHWVRLGRVADFPTGETRLLTFENPLRQPWDGMTAHAGVFVRRLDARADEGAQFRIFAVNCTHLGCPVTWFPQSGLFMCPCHGGVYYEDGERASGPPPRGLYHCVWRVADGQLEVQAPHLPSLQDPLDSSEPRAQAPGRVALKTCDREGRS
jgi:Rieske Fe-S protein